jgi:hypothetical protein
MPRQEEKIRRIRETATKMASNPEPLERPRSQLQIFKWVIFGLGLCATAGFVGHAAYREIHRPNTVIDAINVPEELLKRGYNGAVVAAKLADQATRIGLSIENQSKQYVWHADAKLVDNAIPTAEITDIVLPNASWSFHGMLRFFLEELGVSLPRIGGEITVNGEEATLTLRRLGDSLRAQPQIVAGKLDNIDRLLFKGGNALLTLTNPKAALLDAYYSFNADGSGPNKTNADLALRKLLQVINYAVEYAPTGDECLAYTLWGVVMVNKNRTPV